MTRTAQKARLDIAANRDAQFDWDRHNRELDAALDRWLAAETALSQAHIDMARDVRAMIKERPR